MAHVLTDESFALSLAHFGRIGRADVPGYWIAAAFIFIPWQTATVAGWLGGQLVPDPTALGLDVVFPAAMGALAVAVITGRRELAAAVGGIVVGVAVALLTSTSIGIVAGGLVGPAIGLAVPRRGSDATIPDDAPSLDGHDESIGVAP